MCDESPMNVEGRDAPRPRGDDVGEALLAHHDRFRTWLRRRLGSAADAEDVLQQSLLRAIERRQSLRDPRRAVAWFDRILRHTLADYYRARSADERRHEAFQHAVIVQGRGQAPPVEARQEPVCPCLHRLLPELNVSYAALLRRIYLQGEPSGQVAADFGMTRNNLMVRLHRARRALRTRLERFCGPCAERGCITCTCE
jgi:RNA polymerase sigma factor (sigma-70 family)